MTRLAIIGMSIAWVPMFWLWMWLSARQRRLHPYSPLTAEAPNPYSDAPDSAAFHAFELRRQVDIALVRVLMPVVERLARLANRIPPRRPRPPESETP